LDNIGSLVVSNFTCSPGNATSGGFVLNSIAATAGESFFINSAFECNLNGPSVQLVGTSGTPIAFCYFMNCEIGGGASQVSGGCLEIDYATNCKWIGGEITGNHDGVRIKNVGKHLVFSGQEYQVLGKPHAFDSGAVIDDITVSEPGYQGAGVFWDSSLLTGANTGAFSIYGGKIGTATTKVNAVLTAGLYQKVDVQSSNKGHLTAPGMPATTVAYLNAFMCDCFVTITGGTVTVISIDGVATNLTSGTFVVPAGRNIAITYSAAPTWVWLGI
jgi:hypothetical protein